MLREEIARNERRVQQLQEAVKRHPEDSELIATAKTEFAALRSRLDELYDRQKRFAAESSGSAEGHALPPAPGYGQG